MGAHPSDRAATPCGAEPKVSGLAGIPCAVHYSSATDLWPTPQDTFDALDREFGFGTDVCAIASNAKCPTYFTPEQDGLSKDWSGVCWMNPPYGREIGKWMRKAYESSLIGATIVCLVPARTDTAWWHDYAAKGEVRFLRGRLKFNGIKDAPFPSAVVVFRPPAIAMRCWHEDAKRLSPEEVAARAEGIAR